MTRLRRQFLWLGAVTLVLSGHPACAEGLSGEMQMVSVPSKDRRAQRSLTEISVFLDHEISSEVSAFAVGYHDQQFRSASAGLTRKLGHWQLGLGVGQAAFDDMNHWVINPWAYYAEDDYKGYLHYESYRKSRTDSHFMKGYALKHLGAFSLGAHAEMKFGLGPRVEAKLGDGLRLWGVVPVAHRPREGAMKGMLGVSAEF